MKKPKTRKTKAKPKPAAKRRPLRDGMKLYLEGSRHCVRTLERLPNEGRQTRWQVTSVDRHSGRKIVQWYAMPAAEVRGLLRDGTYHTTIRSGR